MIQVNISSIFDHAQRGDMKVLKPPIFSHLTLFLLLGVFLVGCSQVFPSAQGLEVALPTPKATEAPTDVPIPATEVADEPTSTLDAQTEVPAEETVEETATPTLESSIPSTELPPATLSAEVPTEAPALNTVLGSSELFATDPASFNPASGKVQVVEFFAFWCHVCRAMAPLMHGLEDKYKGRANFVYLDIDDDATETLRLTFQFYYQPHIFLLDAEGNILQQWIGYVRQAELEAALVNALE